MAQPTNHEECTRMLEVPFCESQVVVSEGDELRDFLDIDNRWMQVVRTKAGEFAKREAKL